MNHLGQAVADQNQRLIRKSQDQRLINLAVAGAGISHWEAKVLVEAVEEVYLREPSQRPMKSGQVRYECIAGHEGAGKPLSECRQQTVILTVYAVEDLEVEYKQGATAVRRLRLGRIAEEAREQGGLLSQEDLHVLLMSDVRTIRRDIQALRKQKIIIPTRGQVQDIGPGVTHRQLALQHWLDGQEPVEVARAINHSLTATERYIQHFSRVTFLHRKGFQPLQIALTVGISSATVRIYLELYEESRSKPFFQQRMEELEQIGASHFEAEDEKKGAPSRPGKSLDEWRQP
jgi:Protein of unknown function (DUF1670)